MTNNLNLYLKIAACRAGIKALGKTGQNNMQGYKYSSDLDFTEAIRPVLVETGLLILPSTKKVETIRQEGRDGKHGYLTTVEVEYLVIDSESGEGVALTGYGAGSDPQDKGLYKAYTGCFKYLLKQLFVLAGDEDAENDSKDAHQGSKSEQPRQGYPQTYNSTTGKATEMHTGSNTGHSSTPKVQPNRQTALAGLQAEKWGYKVPFDKNDARLTFLWGRLRAHGMDYTSKKNGGDGIQWCDKEVVEAKEYLVSGPKTATSNMPAMDNPAVPDMPSVYMINEDGSEDDLAF